MIEDVGGVIVCLMILPLVAVAIGIVIMIGFVDEIVLYFQDRI